MANISNPPIPFVGAIPGGFRRGRMITIQGKIADAPDGFSVNLCSGPQLSPLGDTALHFNPRFSSFCVVRNHLVGGSWGNEEKSGGLPFYHGQPFTIVILSDQHLYKISVNGVHFCDFRHRLNPDIVTYLIINGSLKLTSISYDGGATPAYSPTQPPNLFSPGASYPVPSQQIFNPPIPVPFTTPVQGGLYTGRIFSISGIPTAGGQRFNVNLHCGPYDNDVALTFDVRFNFGQDRSVVVRNSRIGGNWGNEERHVTHFPFMQNVNFMIMILVEVSSFKIAVNNQHFTEFGHRIQPFSKADTLKIGGDVILTQVRIQ